MSLRLALRSSAVHGRRVDVGTRSHLRKNLLWGKAVRSAPVACIRLGICLEGEEGEAHGGGSVERSRVRLGRRMVGAFPNDRRWIGVGGLASRGQYRDVRHGAQGGGGSFRSTPNS